MNKKIEMALLGSLESGRRIALTEEAKGRTLKGRINVYACTPPLTQSSVKGGCGHWIVTIDRDTGVTPMFVKCGHCGGMATSRMYKVGFGLEPTHEWFRPATVNEIPVEYRGEGSIDHLRNGGLVMRPIGDGKWFAPTPEMKAFIEDEQRRIKAMMK
jgi:hypothetical protein